MTSPERYVVKVSEAEQALTFRLQSWGVKDAEDKAAEFIAVLIRHGWKPWAPVTALPRPPRTATAPPHELLEGVRTQLRAARPSLPTEPSPEGADDA